MDPGCKEAEMVPGKDSDGFRENGAVEGAGENDTLIANRLSPDPEASSILVSASLTKIETRFKAPQSMVSKSASTLFRATNIRSLVHSFFA